MANETPYKQLLDFWTPPKDIVERESISGPIPISFISTSYTFDSEFFDEECLTRFLCMETEKENDGVAFLIEREEKLAGLKAGIILVDQNNCKGERSLRWDLVPCRVKNGIMHAKITVLHWSNCIRIIIGSANLTQSGYCLNQEGFGVIDYYPDCDGDLRVINDVLQFIKTIVDEYCGKVVRNRFIGVQEEIKKYLKKWNIIERVYKRDELSIQTLFVSPKGPDAFTELKNIWNNKTSTPADQIYITSPFFDTSSSPHTPSVKVYDILRQRGGSVEVQYFITTDSVSENDQKVVVNAPEFLKVTTKPESQIISFKEVKELGLNEENKSVPRPLHLKSIWLCNNEFHLYILGSSNFTSPALGLGNRVNYEANLIYGVSALHNGNLVKQLDECHIKGNLLETTQLTFRARANEDEDTEQPEFLLLPGCFGEAVIKGEKREYLLELNFSSSNLPEDFEIFVRNKQTVEKHSVVYKEKEWIIEGKPKEKILALDINSLPDYLEVSWKNSGGKAFWPVIIENQITLPAVDVLRDLPLEALMQILASSQPLYRLLKIINGFKKTSKDYHKDETIIDPHKLVDTTGYLLQRTRRVSYTLVSLRQRLEKPVFTKDALSWRLYGPIGVNSLIEAIHKEAKTDEEKQFLLAELALELSRIQPQILDNTLSIKEIKSSIREILGKLHFVSESDTSTLGINIYSKKAVQKALNDL